MVDGEWSKPVVFSRSWRADDGISNRNGVMVPPCSVFWKGQRASHSVIVKLHICWPLLPYYFPTSRGSWKPRMTCRAQPTSPAECLELQGKETVEATMLGKHLAGYRSTFQYPNNLYIVITVVQHWPIKWPSCAGTSYIHWLFGIRTLILFAHVCPRRGAPVRCWEYPTTACCRDFGGIFTIYTIITRHHSHNLS